MKMEKIIFSYSKGTKNMNTLNKEGGWEQNGFIILGYYMNTCTFDSFCSATKWLHNFFNPRISC